MECNSAGPKLTGAPIGNTQSSKCRWPRTLQANARDTVAAWRRAPAAYHAAILRRATAREKADPRGLRVAMAGDLESLACERREQVASRTAGSPYVARGGNLSARRSSLRRFGSISAWFVSCTPATGNSV